MAKSARASSGAPVGSSAASPSPPDQSVRPLVKQAHGGALLRPWQPGQSGNPAGRGGKKPVTEAYERIVRMSMDPLALAHFKTEPKTGAERMAWAMFERGCDTENKLGVQAAKEITDRVEGTSIQTVSHGDGQGGPIRVRLEFTPMGPKTIIEQPALEAENPDETGDDA